MIEEKKKPSLQSTQRLKIGGAEAEEKNRSGLFAVGATVDNRGRRVVWPVGLSVGEGGGGGGVSTGGGHFARTEVIVETLTRVSESVDVVVLVGGRRLVMVTVSSVAAGMVRHAGDFDVAGTLPVVESVGR